MPVPPMPLGDDEQVSSPMPGGPPGGGYPPPSPTGAGPGGDLASLLGMGGAPPTNGEIDPLQMGLAQFDMLAQTISDIARMFPGTEQRASEMMEILDMWRQDVAVMNTPQPSAMPGADMMM